MEPTFADGTKGMTVSLEFAEYCRVGFTENRRPSETTRRAALLQEVET